MQYALIGSYGLQMTITLLLVLVAWTLKVLASKTDTISWYSTNALRIIISLGLCWLIAAGLVIVPGISIVLGGIGFNADQGTAAIAVTIAGFLVKKNVSPGDKPISLN